MKIKFMGKWERVTCWSAGLYVVAFGGTLVALVGTGWQFGFRVKPTAFGLCFGPFTIGGAR